MVAIVAWRTWQVLINGSVLDLGSVLGLAVNPDFVQVLRGQEEMRVEENEGV